MFFFPKLTMQAHQRYKGSMNEMQQLREALECRPYRISYQAFKDEIDPNSVPHLQSQSLKKIEIVPQSQVTDPNRLAQNLKPDFPPTETHILIPGQAFDLLGTRHGRGFGWYDRLLASLSEDILRLGIAHEHQVRQLALVRKPWDQPVDWLIYPARGEWQVHKTNARPL